MDLLTLYARKVLSDDPFLAKYAPGARRYDVHLFSDPEMKNLKAVWSWDKHPPDRRNKYVTLNCYRWRLEWRS